MDQQQPQQPQYAPIAPAPKKKRGKVKWFVLGAIALIVVISVASNSGDSEPIAPAPAGGATTAAPAQAPAKKKNTVMVTYKVSGPSTASMTYAVDGMGKSSQANGESLPWAKDVEIEKGLLGRYGLIAQSGDSGGAITCEIAVDGKVVDTQTSTGGYAVVSCSSK